MASKEYQAPPTTVRFRVMAFLCVLSFLTYFDRICIVRAQDAIKNDLGISDTQMGWIFGAFWLAYGLFEIPVGWWGDRFGARRTLTRIVFAWSLFTFLSGSAVGFLSLLTFRFLFGMGEAGAYPNMARIQSQWLPMRSRARAGGLLWLMARWGAAFSPILFGRMLRIFDSPALRNHLASIPLLHRVADIAPWRLGFWASGGMGVIWIVAFYPWFRDNPADKRSVNRAELDLINAGQPPRAERHVTPPGMWRALFTCPSLWGMALLYFCGSFGWSFFASWTPRFLKDVHHIPFENSEWMTALPFFLAGISCLAGGMLSDALVRKTGWRRFGRAIFPITGCTVAALAMLSIRFVHSPGQAIALMCVAAAAYDFGQGANWATIVDIGGAYAGTAAGFNNMIGNMANFIQPVVGQWIFNHLGWDVLFLTYGAAYLAAASMWLFIDPRRPFYEREPQAVLAAQG